MPLRMQANMSYSLSPEERLFLSLSGTDFAEKCAGMFSGNYDRLLELANLNQVSPIMYRNLQKVQGVPEHVMEGLNKAYLATFLQNVRHSQETMRIIGLPQMEGIEVIPLKGSLFSDIVLGDMGLYPTCDIDLLVHPRDLERAKSAIVGLGYSEGSTLAEEDRLQGSYHLSFSNNTYVVELHWNLVMRYFEAPPDFWWEDAGIIEYEGTVISVLAPEKYLLYAIFRLFSHGFIPLRFSILVSGIVGKYGGQIDWSKFLSCAGELKMNRVSLFTLKLLHELLGVDIPQEIANRRVFGYDFLKRIVMKGLFKGVKRTRLRMAFFTILMDTPLNTLRVLFRRLLPKRSELRLRYGLSPDSKKVFFYYLLNPFFLVFRRR